MPLGDHQDRVHVAGLSIEMDRHDGPGPVGDGSFDAAGVQVEGADIRFRENGPGPHIGDRQGRGDVRVGGNDHLIPLADAQRLQNEHQCVQAIAHAHAMFHRAILGKGFLKGLILHAADVPAALEHPVESILQRRAQLFFHGEKADKRYFHKWYFSL